MEELTITLCQVKVKFSKEIFSYGDRCYYENPKFWEYWDKYNRRMNKKKYGSDVWRVAYCTKEQEKKAKQGRMPSGMRYLINDDTCILLSSDWMSILLINRPDMYRTSIRYDLGALYCAIKECAAYCGGTAEFTYTEQQVLQYKQESYATLKLPEREKK